MECALSRCRADTPSHFYSYFFELNPDWTTYTPAGGEMQDYLVGSADKYGLRERIQFNTIVVSLRWIEGDRQMEILMRAKYGR